MKIQRTFLSLVAIAASCASVFSQTTWEFDGTPYAYQKTHFDSATGLVRTKLGIQMHTFGAPYNQIDTTFRRVMSEDTSYKVLLLGQVNPFPWTGAVNLTRRVQIENGTGNPDFAYFLADYDTKKLLYTDYMVMQGHPYAWTTQAKLTAFQDIVNYLIADTVVFNTPYGYYRYLTDPSIPRTNRVQVILKLDDLRATSSFFYPCFPSYDFLVAHRVKAAFGVNWMWNLTQAQADTLQYYMAQTDSLGGPLFEIWNHGLDHSMNQGSAGGNWSSPETWPDGTVPTASDDVVIPAGVTVTIDVANAECQNLTINGTLEALNTAATGLTVTGNVLINSGASFTSPYLSTGTSNIIHTLTVYGNFTNAGGTFDFRTGSAGTTMRVMNTSFLGSNNSTISVGTYSSSNNDFNSITVDKSNGARVICASDVFIDQGASTCRSQLTLTNGIVETGNHAIHVLSLTSADLITPSVTSYIQGALGRGMSNSGGKSCFFPVGDANGYRPLTVVSTTAGVASGHYVLVRCIPADANTGSSTLTGGIDAVSRIRYYKIGYSKGIGTGADSMKFDRFYPTYGADDGVAVGNNDLRCAYSANDRATWIGLGQTSYPHTTNLTNPPTQIKPDSLSAPLTLYNNTSAAFVVLANATGGANPLGRSGPTFVPDSVSLNFGSVPVSATRTDSISVSNPGGFQLIITSVISTNARFGVTPTSATISVGGSAKFYVTFSPTEAGDQSGTIEFTHNAVGSPTSIPVTGSGVTSTFNIMVALGAGWNMISNPVTTTDDSVTQLFPTSSFAYAFAFQPGSGYVQSTRMANGTGYWGKFPTAVSQQVFGLPRAQDSIIVAEGWNMVGSISCALDTGSVISVPPGLRASSWFGYGPSGYLPATQIEPGKGYWVKANGSGRFAFACPGESKKESSVAKMKTGTGSQ